MPFICAAMPTFVKVILIILGVILALFIALIIVGRRMQKKQQASQADIEAASQVLSMLVIDKKRMKLKDANLPKIISDQVPKYMRAAKMPLVKAKVGPKVMTLIADAKIFEDLPVKTEIKAKVSGIYITEVISSRAKVVAQPKKQTFRGKMIKKASEAQEKNNDKLQSLGKKKN